MGLFRGVFLGGSLSSKQMYGMTNLNIAAIVSVIIRILIAQIRRSHHHNSNHLNHPQLFNYLVHRFRSTVFAGSPSLGIRTSLFS